MPAAFHPLLIEAGVTFRGQYVWQQPSAAGLAAGEEIDPDNDLHWEPVSLAGYTAHMQIKETHDSAAWVTVSSADDITLEPGGELGVIDVVVKPGETRLVLREGVYDLELHGASADDVERLLYGPVKLVREVTTSA